MIVVVKCRGDFTCHTLITGKRGELRVHCTRILESVAFDRDTVATPVDCQGNRFESSQGSAFFRARLEKVMRTGREMTNTTNCTQPANHNDNDHVSKMNAMHSMCL